MSAGGIAPNAAHQQPAGDVAVEHGRVEQAVDQDGRGGLLDAQRPGQGDRGVRRQHHMHDAGVDRVHVDICAAAQRLHRGLVEHRPARPPAAAVSFGVAVAVLLDLGFSDDVL